jgi:hypothetical protein
MLHGTALAANAYFDTQYLRPLDVRNFALSCAAVSSYYLVAFLPAEELDMCESLLNPCPLRVSCCGEQCCTKELCIFLIASKR